MSPVLMVNVIIIMTNVIVCWFYDYRKIIRVSLSMYLYRRFLSRYQTYKLKFYFSFVQEFVSTPMDGVTLLLEVLRSIQLSQTANLISTTSSPANTIQRNSQAYQRRALLDELACL